MKKFYIIIIILLWGIIHAVTIDVNLDGSGDYTSIQEGINAASDYDTVLVYPGRYFENTDFNGKTITVCSLEMLTGDRAYIHSTIIDANQTGCCVAVHNFEESGTVLRGFTLTNGIGYLSGSRRYGGGIFHRDASIVVINCIIENNKARGGGGISVSGFNVTLEGCIIRNNTADFYGGGIGAGRLDASICFSYNNRCSIYDNFAPKGFDIYCSNSPGVGTDVIVDTFTVSEPFGYEYYQGDTHSIQDYSTVFDALNYKYNRVCGDLYVSPDGDDDNSGLFEDDPLKTINHAFRIISADENNPCTIHLAEGTYSTQDNDQYFPVNMRAYVSLIGESRENTVIDLGAGNQGFLLDFFSEMNYEISNMKIQNGFVDDDDLFFHYGIYIINWLDYTGRVEINNLDIINNDFEFFIYIGNMDLCISEINFMFNQYSMDSSLYSFSKLIRYSAQNLCEVIFQNIRSMYNELGRITVFASPYNQVNDSNISIINCEFCDNSYENIGFTPESSIGTAISSSGDVDLNIINCTFGENIYEGPNIGSAPLKLGGGSEANIINCIIYDNNTYSVITLYESGLETIVNMNHNIVEGGVDGVLAGDLIDFTWDEETNWDEDPLYVGEGYFPFSVQEGSPAIDAGTLDLPEGVQLPEYDLAGNPRIMGEGIDLGAYEYDPIGSEAGDNVISVASDLIVYPNPLISSNMRDGHAKILWFGEESLEEMSCVIFNVKGQKIRQINQFEEMENGRYFANWNMKDSAGEQVSSGVYFIRIKNNDDYIAQQKVTVVK